MWPGRELAEEDFALYAEALKELNVQTLDWACEQAFKTSKFFPVPADILGQVKKHDEAKLELEASAAWGKVLRYVTSVGANLQDASAKLTYKEILAAKHAGGLEYLERCPEEELQWRKKEFVAAYENQATIEDSRRPLTDGESKKFLAEARKQLAAAGRDTVKRCDHQ